MGVAGAVGAAPSGRLRALDVFRGLTVALMILVNNPGSWSQVYAPLLHADWHGLTPTDLVFPFFLFIVGASMALSFDRHHAAPGAAWPAILRRGLLIVAIGVLLNAYPFTAPIGGWRWLGVLQRIGLAFLIAGGLVLLLRPAALRWAALGLLAVYGGLLATVGDPAYTLEHNLVRQLDLAVLGPAHLWQGKGLPFDPEGLLGTLPAVANVLIGHEVLRWWRARRFEADAVPRLVATGALLLAGGLVWALWQPINKSLWTPSYALVTAGLAVWALLLVARALRRPALQRAAVPFEAFGLNPLALYVLSWLWVASYPLLRIGGEGLGDWMYRQLALALSPKNASLAYAVGHVLLFGAVAMVLYRRRIVIKL